MLNQTWSAEQAEMRRLLLSTFDQPLDAQLEFEARDCPVCQDSGLVGLHSGQYWETIIERLLQKSAVMH